MTLVAFPWPPPFSFAFAFLPRVVEVGLQVLLASIALGVVIGRTEVLWRGPHVELFDDCLFGPYYPAVWFGLWHFAPQAVEPDPFPGAPYSFVLSAIVPGLSYGYYPGETGSIR